HPNDLIVDDVDVAYREQRARCGSGHSAETGLLRFLHQIVAQSAIVTSLIEGNWCANQLGWRITSRNPTFRSSPFSGLFRGRRFSCYHPSHSGLRGRSMVFTFSSL